MPKTLPRNGELADQLDLLADLSEILEEESFKVIAYRRAAGRIREAAVPIAELAIDGKAKELPGIGKTIEAKVVEVVEDGEMHALTKRRGLVPAGVVDFLRLPGVGPKTAARIWTQLGITSLDGLKTAAEAGRLRDLSGMGARSEEKILKALEAGVGDKAEERRLLATALPAVRRVVGELEAHPAAIAVSEAGSVRRRRETVRDLDLIATSSDPPALIDAFCSGDWVSEVVARGDTKATVVSHDALRFDLRVVPEECYGNVLQHFTGSKDHNIALREEAQRRGLSISEYGVTEVESGEVVTHADEDELYALPRLPNAAARAARRHGRDRGVAERRSARARRARRPHRRAPLPLDVVDGREGNARGDGAAPRRAAAIGSSASPTTPTTCATGGSRRSGRRSTRSTRA